MTSRRILLVEDEILIALHTEDILVEGGYEVVGPIDRVDAAVAAAEREPLDGAVLDINLAGVRVWPVADALGARGIPFILLTGFDDGLDSPAAHRSVPRLGKPIMRAELLEMLDALLRNTRSGAASP